MFDVVRAVWDKTYGLLVDDGQLALGAIAALMLTWLVASVAPEPVRDSSGWLLLALVLALVLANLYVAGTNARRRAS